MGMCKWAGACALWLGMSAAWAQEGRSLPDEYEKQIKSAEVVGALGNDLFGEQINFYTGSGSFVANDFSLPGNDALPVGLAREYRVEPQAEVPRKGLFADWDIQIPHLQGIFHLQWLAADGTGSRCTNASAPPQVTYQSTGFDGPEYWSGSHLYLPGGGSQEMLKTVAENPNKPTDGLTYPWVTNNQWYFSCLTTTANSTGQGFLAHAPDGTRYWFNWVASRTAPMLSKGSPAPGLMSSGGAVAMVGNGYVLPRREIWILPTRVEDRFGNYVTYTYDAANPMRLTQMASSDGRVLTLAYNTSGYVATATDGTRTWTYGYTGASLSSVTLPDGSRWQYNFAALNTASYDAPEGGLCNGPTLDTPFDFTGTLTHPSGAQGQFTFRPTLHGRSYVTRTCIALPNGTDYYARFAKRFASLSLKQKTISGPGIASPMTWNYVYGAPNDSFADQCASGCVATKTVEVTGPDDFQRFTFGNRFQDTDGKLLKLESGSSATNILRSEVTTYQTDVTGMAYPVRVGRSPYIRSDRTAEPLMPMKSRVITQQGTVFSWQVDAACGSNGTTLCFDAFARPTRVTKSSAPAP